MPAEIYPLFRPDAIRPLLSAQVAAAEAEIHHRVFKHYQLTPDKIKLLLREVAHWHYS